MGYYYDWIEQNWLPLQHRELTSQQCRRRTCRHRLLSELLTELEAGDDGVSRLYAGLLARRLISRDQELMREFGRQVVETASDGAAAHLR
jgi:hypothetical protein